MKEEYTFVIDTSAYSGNFEREMTAYITGVVGECEVGAKFAEMFNDEVEDQSIVKAVEQRNTGDDYTIFRPCEIAVTPGYVNNGMGKHMLADSDAAKQLKNKWPAYQSVAIFFSEDPYKFTDFIKQRAVEFAELYNRVGKFGRPPSEKVEILGYRIEKTQTKTNTISEYV